MSARLLDGLVSFVTVEGTPLLADSRGGEIIVGGSRVLEKDILATNGILHVIDTLLLPPGRCMADMDCGEGLICAEAGICVPPPPLYTCHNPFIIPSAFDGDVVFEGNTNDRVSREGARCAQGAEGPDHVYLLKGEGKFQGGGDEPLQVCLQTLGSDFDTALHVRRERCNGPEVSCVDDVTVNFGGEQQLQVAAQMTLDVEAGEEYYIFVDSSESVLSGEYVLSVLVGPCEQE